MYVLYLYVHVKKNNKIQFFQLNSAVFWFNVYALSDFQDATSLQYKNPDEHIFLNGELIFRASLRETFANNYENIYLINLKVG